MQVIVHGGAGSEPDDPAARAATLDAAAAAAARADTPLGAVERAVRHLESAPGFNAGVGGARQSDGRVRTDAGVMTGDGRAGAACAMPGVDHAVTVARGVLAETPHVLLAGERAVAFAGAVGVATGVDLTTERTRERWQALDPPGADADPATHLAWVRERFGGTDTVGAVAREGDRVAAATSTGGRWCALAGRVGDVPQVGAGFFAGPAGAASATGEGEAIARTGLARRAVGRLADGDAAERAAEAAIESFEAATGGTAGVVVLGRDGSAGAAHNAAAMGTARRP